MQVYYYGTVDLEIRHNNNIYCTICKSQKLEFQ